MGVKGSIDGIVGGARHMAVGAALLAGLGLASAGCDLFTNPSSPTATPVPPPAAAAPAAPAPTDTPVPPSPTPPPTATRTPVPVMTATPAFTPTAAIAATAAVTATAAVAATPAAATPPAPPLAATATPPGYHASTATPVYIVVTATPAGLVPGVVLTPYFTPPRVAATSTPPVPPSGVLRADYSTTRGYVNDGEFLYSRAQTDYNFPAGARQVFCGLESQIAGSAESVLAGDYPAAMARDRAATLAQRIRAVCSGAQRMLGWTLYHASLYVQRTARLEDRFMVGVEIGVPEPGRESDFFRAPLPDTLYLRLAGDYGFPPDTLVPMRPCSPAPCR